MSRDAGWEFVEHTADLGIRAWGPRLADAFAEAAHGLFAHMVEVPPAEGTRPVQVTATAANPERLLYSFLDELLFLHQTELLVFPNFDVTITPPASPSDEWQLTATAHAEPLDAERHGHVHEIKAITYHEIRVTPGPPAGVFVVVDI